MIVDERMVAYINSLDMGNTPFLEKIQEEALKDRVPIIRREMQSFLKMLLALKRPARILEVGTAVGFSTLLFCEYAPEGAHVTTIEKYEKRIPIARENFKAAGREEQITLLTGDAAEHLKGTGRTAMILFLWMRQRASISISFRMSCACWSLEGCWCRTMCCRMEI